MLMHIISENRGSLMFKILRKFLLQVYHKISMSVFYFLSKFDIVAKSCLDLMLTKIIVKSRGCLMLIILRTKKAV